VVGRQTRRTVTLAALGLAVLAGLGVARSAEDAEPRAPHCIAPRFVPGDALAPGGRQDAPPPVALASGIERALAPSTGSVHLLVILAAFSDLPARVPASRFPVHLFGTGNLSMRQFYLDASGGALSLTGDVYGWVPLPQGRAYYSGGANGAGIGAYPNNGQRMTEDAVQAAISGGLDLRDYDRNGDGEVDALLVIHSGQGYEWGSNSSLTPEPDLFSINSHKWSVLDGDFGAALPRVTDYFTCPELQLLKPVVAPLWADSIATIGVYCHEFGHVLGLPDYYDTGSGENRVGPWDVMDYGTWSRVTGTAETAAPGALPSGFSGWSRMALGWTAAVEIAPPPGQSETLALSIDSASEGGPAVQLGTNPGGPDWAPGSPGTGEFFVVETRTRTGWDAGLPAEGLLIYHVDESRKSNRAADYADGGGLLELRPEDAVLTLGSSGNDPWPGTQNAFGLASDPDSRFWNGSDSGVALQGITPAGSSTIQATAIVTNLVTPLPLPYASPNPWRADLHAGVGIRLVLGSTVPEGTEVVVHDIRGRRVRTLGEADLDPSRQIAIWDGLTDDGTVVSAGMYFFRARNGASGTGKLLVLH